MTDTPPMIKPSDAVSWISCRRRAWLDNQPHINVVPSDDAFEQLLSQQGLSHEANVLNALASEYDVQTATSPEHTAQLMAKQVPVIYQAELIDTHNGIVGKPDFLLLSDNGRYQAADAKLSLTEKKKAIQIQLGVYRQLLNNEQPALVFLGNGEQGTVGDEATAITQEFLRDMRRLLSSADEPAVRYSHSTCSACPYNVHCKPGFEARQDVSLLYGVQGRAAEALEKAGIRTISQLAETLPRDLPDVPYLKGELKKERAMLQARSWLSGSVYPLSPVTLPTGQWIHFDIEDNPLTATGEKHVYLWGFLLPATISDSGDDDFEYDWTDTSDDDESGWQQFLHRVARYRQQFPELILAHYSSHERSTIAHYAKRYAMENDATVQYLLGPDSPLFDLHKTVTEHLILPVQGYGLKAICKHPDLVNFQWQDEGSGSQWSVVQFNHYLTQTDKTARAQLKADILSYNRDDVMATHQLEHWLRAYYME